ncbi:hypothetical protein A2814_01160 [Candidatus Nomurabacteria bacterium RIFCSPHIGHO2_01_FULL_38_19]|uniref:Uncharacterized protein n=1 Tax=Candidatus Nomurabacteria bacterium RIFCSPHIGHO2_01_FULL_38_19 TaxID=1801732 RepID=A0A1F6UUI5_9BACT|nr:MAG: hypothetical protein A2814_01160 [Candidatus Nomurabacteria bacterium RIFCSPHIGHO2_01_FULL_38_19]
MEAMLTRILINKLHSGIGETPITKRAAMSEIIIYTSNPKTSLWIKKNLLYRLDSTVMQSSPIKQTGFSELILVRIR